MGSTPEHWRADEPIAMCYPRHFRALLGEWRKGGHCSCPRRSADRVEGDASAPVPHICKIIAWSRKPAKKLDLSHKQLLSTWSRARDDSTQDGSCSRTRSKGFSFLWPHPG